MSEVVQCSKCRRILEPGEPMYGRMCDHNVWKCEPCAHPEYQPAFALQQRLREAIRPGDDSAVIAYALARMFKVGKARAIAVKLDAFARELDQERRENRKLDAYNLLP
jgi:hypothetical protein